MAGRRSDEVFDLLALSILRGELREGDVLESERSLATRLEVSRGTLREAIHKLADAGLVRVSQGAPTIVLRHEDSLDVRVIALRYKTIGDVEKREVAERRTMQGFTLVYLASLRAKPADVQPLLDRVEAFVAKGSPSDELNTLDAFIWTSIAALGQNRFLEREVGWWYRNGPTENTSEDRGILNAVAPRVAFYRELLRRMRDRDRPAAYYFDLLGILIPS